jgi:hypothetical protein
VEIGVPSLELGTCTNKAHMHRRRKAGPGNAAAALHGIVPLGSALVLVPAALYADVVGPAGPAWHVQNRVRGTVFTGHDEDAILPRGRWCVREREVHFLDLPPRMRWSTDFEAEDLDLLAAAVADAATGPLTLQGDPVPWCPAAALPGKVALVYDPATHTSSAVLLATLFAIGQGDATLHDMQQALAPFRSTLGTVQEVGKPRRKRLEWVPSAPPQDRRHAPTPISMGDPIGKGKAGHVKRPATQGPVSLPGRRPVGRRQPVRLCAGAAQVENPHGAVGVREQLPGTGARGQAGVLRGGKAVHGGGKVGARQRQGRGAL